jgi:hypothetical protein
MNDQWSIHLNVEVLITTIESNSEAGLVFGMIYQEIAPVF